jgi:hypothetical protein
MAEEGELLDVKTKNIPEFIAFGVNEKVEKVGIDKLNENHLDIIFRELEEEGFDFQGDVEMAKFYIEQIIAGVMVPFVQAGKKDLLSKVRLSISNGKQKYLAAAGFADVEVNGKTETIMTVKVNLMTLEDMSHFDPEEEYYYYETEGEVDAEMGPTWYAAREIGVEEGAHALFLLTKDKKEIQPDVIESLEQYHENDLEFEGLYWRIIDANMMLADPYLPPDQRLSISLRLNYLKRLMIASHKRRISRTEKPPIADFSHYRKKILAA